jgi:hypothetical protein
VPDQNRVVYLVPPAETDRRIKEQLKDNYVMYYKNVPENGKLFVFLPGTNGNPVSYQFILDTAAKLGYKAVGISYINFGDTVSAAAKGSDDPANSEKIRRSKFTGEDLTPSFTIAPENGIENRFLALLKHLDKVHPEEKWSQFLSKGEIRWDLVCISGHSQGAGMAAFISKIKAVYRAALISCPGDVVEKNKQFSDWVTRIGVTSPAKIFALYHRDELPNDSQLRVQVAKALGLGEFGAVADADKVQAPYNHSHIIMVDSPPTKLDAEVASGNAAHGSTATDNTTPLSKAGTAKYEPVWRYLFGGEPQ